MGFGFMNTANSIVTLDCRKRRMKNGLKSRHGCRLCYGRAMNIEFCSHEEAVMREVMVKDTSLDSLKIVAPDDMNEDVVRELPSSNSDIENESIVTEVDYRSKFK